MLHTLVFVIQDLHLCTSGPGRLTPKSCNWYGLLIDTPPLVVGYAGSLGPSLKYLGWNKPCSRFDNQKLGNLKKNLWYAGLWDLIGPLSKYLGWNKLCLRSTEGRGWERKEGGRKKGGGVWGEKEENCFFAETNHRQSCSRVLRALDLSPLSPLFLLVFKLCLSD